MNNRKRFYKVLDKCFNKESDIKNKYIHDDIYNN